MKKQEAVRLALIMESIKNNVAEVRAQLAMQNWGPYSRLFLINDCAAWSLSHDMQMMGELCVKYFIILELD